MLSVLVPGDLPCAHCTESLQGKKLSISVLKTNRSHKYKPGSMFVLHFERSPELGSYENRILVHLEGSFNSAQIFDLLFSFLEPVSSSANGGERVQVRSRWCRWKCPGWCGHP